MLQRRLGRLAIRVLAGPSVAIAHIGTFALLVGFVGLLIGSARDALGAGTAVGALIGAIAALRQLSERFPPAQAFALPADTELHRSDRLVLRTPRRDDRSSADATIDDEVVRANGWTPQLRRINSVLFRFPASAAETGLILVADSATDEVRGVMSIGPMVGDGRPVQIGGWIGPRDRGSGLAADALRGTAQIAFVHGATEVVSGTSTDNAGMRRSLERAGGRSFGDIRAHELPDGTTAPSVWFMFDRGRSDGAGA